MKDGISRNFVSVRSIGRRDTDGIDIVSITKYTGEQLAEENRPLQTMVMPILDHIMRDLRYTDRSKIAEDMKVFKAWVANISDDSVDLETEKGDSDAV